MDDVNCNGYIVIGSGMGIKQNKRGDFDFSINTIGLEPDSSKNVHFTQHREQTRELYELLKKIFESDADLT